MYAKIQIFQIEGKNSKNWLCSDTDNVKTSMYTKNEAVWPIRYREKRVLVCENAILRKTHLSLESLFFTFEIATYTKVLQNELDSILRFY